jgi:superfamily II DNA or RNA helicase
VAELTEAELRASFNPAAVSAGRQYAAARAVGSVQVGSGGDDTVLQAQVRGSSGRPYYTVVRRHAGGRLTSNCSCPVNRSCKHGAAVLWAAHTAAVEGVVPAWRRALAQVAEQARRTAEAGVALALQVDRSRTGEVRLRPLMQGQRERWVKTGVSWDTLERPWTTRYNEPQRQLLLALRRTRRAADSYYYSYRSDALELDQLSGQAWPLLGALADAGIPLLPGPGTPPVRLAADAARVAAAVTPVGAGDLEITTRVVVDGLLGEPPHGVVLATDAELLLAPFATPLEAAQRALLLQHPRIVVPEADLPQFAAGFLPGLRRQVELELAAGVVLPQLEPPTLVLRVGFAPGHHTLLRWTLRYRVGEATFELSPVPASADPVLRDFEAEAGLLRLLPQLWWARSEDAAGPPRLLPQAGLAGAESAAFVTDWLPRLQELPGVVVEVEGDVPDYRFTDSAPLVRFSVGEPGEGTDWFSLDVTISVDGETVGFRELFAALAHGDDHLILDSGTWFSLDRPELAQLRAVIEEARRLQPSGQPGLRLRAEHAGLWEELLTLGVVAEQSVAWQQSVAALLDATAVPEVAVPEVLSAELRHYQVEGYRWLSFLWEARLGGILADDMGLGKTLQLLAAICRARELRPDSPPVLVVAPTSVLRTWEGEAARFAPGLRVAVVERTARKRTESLAELRAGADVVVTSYTLLRLDEEEYAAEGWEAVVLDEAQFVKNRQARVYKAVRRLRSRTKFAVTGTPLENNLMDLWSLLSIVAPGLFASPDVFAELYRRPIEMGSDPAALPRLRRRIRPLLLRRTKDAVATELPPKQEQVLSVALEPAHRRLYDRHLAAERKRVLGLVDDLDTNRITILRSLTLLRQLSLSPALIDDDLPGTSAKIDALVDLVQELAAEGHRALVFSQFTSFLALVRKRLDAERIAYSYLDGRTRKREERITAFREGADPVFLISLKAGGFGLTLTEADYVFILDPWWNPAAENQAIDRTHRIGQDSPVMVYRLVSEDTIEEKVVALQQRKRDLFSRVVEDGSGLGAPLTADDIRGLLAAD